MWLFLNNPLSPICAAHTQIGLGYPLEHGQPTRSQVAFPALAAISSWAPPTPVLECCLAWSCAGPVQAVPAGAIVQLCSRTVVSRGHRSAPAFPNPQLLAFLPFLLGCSLSLGGKGYDIDVLYMIEHSTKTLVFCALTVEGKVSI